MNSDKKFKKLHIMPVLMRQRSKSQTELMSQIRAGRDPKDMTEEEKKAWRLEVEV